MNLTITENGGKWHIKLVSSFVNADFVVGSDAKPSEPTPDPEPMKWKTEDILINHEQLKKDAELRWELSNIEQHGPNWKEKVEPKKKPSEDLSTKEQLGELYLQQLEESPPTGEHVFFEGFRSRSKKTDTVPVIPVDDYIDDLVRLAKNNNNLPTKEEVPDVDLASRERFFEMVSQFNTIYLPAIREEIVEALAVHPESINVELISINDINIPAFLYHKKQAYEGEDKIGKFTVRVSCPIWLHGPDVFLFDHTGHVGDEKSAQHHLGYAKEVWERIKESFVRAHDYKEENEKQPEVLSLKLGLQRQFRNIFLPIYKDQKRSDCLMPSGV